MLLHVRDARKRVPPLIAPCMAGVVSTAVNPSAVEASCDAILKGQAAAFPGSSRND
jgi:hypothetical protein